MEGDSNEEMQAGAGSEAGANAVPEKPEKRKAQVLVSGGGDPAAGGEGAEQQGEPAQEAGEGAGVVSDGTGNGSGAVADGAGSGGHADLRNGSGADPSGSVGDGDTVGGDIGLRAGTGVRSGKAVSASADGSGPAPSGSIADVSDGNPAADGGGTAQDADGVDGNSTIDKPDDAAALLKRLLEDTGLKDEVELVDMAKVGTSLMSRIDYLVEIPGTFAEWSPAEDPAEIVDDMFRHIEDLEEMRDQFRKLVPAIDVELLLCATPAGYAVVAAIIAYNVTLVMADEIRRKLLGPDAAPPERPIKIAMLMDMVAFVRKIGERATADVVGQQLRILRHRESAELSASEAVAVSAFIDVLRALDGLARDEQAAIDKAEAAKARVAPEPLPIGETTMEPVDGPMDTWGGAA